MVTVVNTPPSNNEGNGTGFLVGIILLIVFGVLFFVYGLPMIQNVMNDGVQVDVNPQDINVNVEEATPPAN